MKKSKVITIFSALLIFTAVLNAQVIHKKEPKTPKTKKVGGAIVGNAVYCPADGNVTCYVTLPE